MQFMLVIHADATAYPAPGTPENDALHEGWMTYTQEIVDAGIRVSGAALMPATTAKTVSGQERLVVDGPFAETKEQLGGFYVVDVPDIETAVDWAGRMPHLGIGAVEVRPVMEIPDAP